MTPKDETSTEQDPGDARPVRRRRSLGSFFLRGVVTVLPVVLTIAILVLVFNFATQYVTQPINRTIYWALDSNGIGWRVLDWMEIDPYALEYLDAEKLPTSPDLARVASEQPAGFESTEFRTQLATWRDANEGFVRDFDTLAIDRAALRDEIRGHVPPLLAIAASLLLVLLLGRVASGFVGRRVISLVDRALNHIPGVRSVYPYSKQFTEFVFGESKLEFDTVVSVPYPSKGLWSIGFVTNHAPKTVCRETRKDMVAVFVPSSPMPFTGYTIFVEASRLIPLPISVDEALRMTVSGGVLIPPQEQFEGDFRDALSWPLRKDPEDEVDANPPPVDEAEVPGLVDGVRTESVDGDEATAHEEEPSAESARDEDDDERDADASSAELDGRDQEDDEAAPVRPRDERGERPRRR
jgi:uncharacterized membrane protein